MGEGPIAVVDTNVLLNLMTPVVDGRSIAPSGGDPFKAVLTAYDVHVPASVLGEVSSATGGGDRLATAAEAVLQASHRLETHDVADEIDDSQTYGLDEGEAHGIWLANRLEAAMFVTDEFNTTNYLLISLGLEDRNTLFTTPHVLCHLATHDVLDSRYVDALLIYYVRTKNWDQAYIERLREEYLSAGSGRNASAVTVGSVRVRE